MTTRRTRSGQLGLIDEAEAAFVAYRAGDRESMGDLVDLLTPILWHAARAQRVSSATADDVVQLAWLRLVRGADRIEDPRAVLAWLLTTVRREARRTAGKLRREDAELDTAGEPTDDSEPSPEDTIILTERQQVLWKHVDALDDRCRELLRVVAFARRPDYAAISTSLGMPVGSIGPTRGRCLQKLRRRLEADDCWKGHDHG